MRVQSYRFGSQMFHRAVQNGSLPFMVGVVRFSRHKDRTRQSVLGFLSVTTLSCKNIKVNLKIVRQNYTKQEKKVVRKYMYIGQECQSLFRYYNISRLFAMHFTESLAN